jgi:hypothetical protein
MPDGELYIKKKGLSYIDAEINAKKNYEKVVQCKYFPFKEDIDFKGHQYIDPSYFKGTISIKNDSFKYSRELNINGMINKTLDSVFCDDIIKLYHGFIKDNIFYKFDMAKLNERLIEKNYYEYVLINDSNVFTTKKNINEFEVTISLSLLKDKFYDRYGLKDIIIPVNDK